jgi:hypothetical protein
MNTTVLIFIGLVAPFFLIVYREFIGDMLGEASWMRLDRTVVPKLSPPNALPKEASEC